MADEQGLGALRQVMELLRGAGHGEQADRLAVLEAELRGDDALTREVAAVHVEQHCHIRALGDLYIAAAGPGYSWLNLLGLAVRQAARFTAKRRPGGKRQPPRIELVANDRIVVSAADISVQGRLLASRFIAAGPQGGGPVGGGPKSGDTDSANGGNADGGNADGASPGALFVYEYGGEKAIREGVLDLLRSLGTPGADPDSA